jgi:hypothetical protein
MGIRTDHTPWSPEEYARFLTLTANGVSASGVAEALNREFHGNVPLRTEAAVSNKRRKNHVKVGRIARPAVAAPPSVEQEVEQRDCDGATEARSLGRRIRSVDDLLAHIGADLTRFEVEKSEATKYETATRGEDGAPQITELHRVFVRLRPKAGPSVLEQVEAMIAGAMSGVRHARVRPPLRKSGTGVMQVIVVADPHVGKYAWSRETGWQDYDIAIATRLLRESIEELIADGDARQVERRVILMLGDYFHYDTPHGQTTGGTALDRDGRIEKMIESGAAVLFDMVESSAMSVPTEVVLVPGNHDAVLTTALRQILSAYFRNDKRVRIDERGTTRKYIRHGKCLIGAAHGDKARKRLGELMAAEAPLEWGASTCREIHTGHLHSIGEVQTIAGVVVRTAPALCPPDGWHAAEGFVGAVRGMESYFYHESGCLVGMTMATPREVPHGKKANERIHEPKGQRVRGSQRAGH